MKKIMLALLLLVLVLAFSACGGKNDTPATEAPTDSTTGSPETQTSTSLVEVTLPIQTEPVTDPSLLTITGITYPEKTVE